MKNNQPSSPSATTTTALTRNNHSNNNLRAVSDSGASPVTPANSSKPWSLGGMLGLGFLSPSSNNNNNNSTPASNSNKDNKPAPGFTSTPTPGPGSLAHKAVKVGMIVPKQAVLFYCTSLINGLPGTMYVTPTLLIT